MGEWLSRSRALACHARGRGFKSRLSRSIYKTMALQKNQLKKDLKNFTTIRPQNIGGLMLPFQVRYGSIHSNSKKASNQGKIKSENSFIDKKENDLPIKTDNELKSLIEEETIETTFLLALSKVHSRFLRFSWSYFLIKFLVSITFFFNNNLLDKYLFFITLCFFYTYSLYTGNLVVLYIVLFIVYVSSYCSFTVIYFNSTKTLNKKIYDKVIKKHFS